MWVWDFCDKAKIDTCVWHQNLGISGGISQSADVRDMLVYSGRLMLLTHLANFFVLFKLRETILYISMLFFFS